MESKAEIILKSALEQYRVEWNASYPSDQELEYITFSPEFEKKMDKLIRRRRKPYYIFINTALKRAVVIALIAIVSLSAMMSVEAIRTPVIKFIIEVYEKFTDVCFSVEDDTSYVELTSIEEVYFPSYIPSGFDIEAETSDTFYVYYEYVDKNDHYFIFTQQLYNESTILSLNTEGVETEDIETRGQQGIYYENLGVKSVVWTEGGYLFIIRSDLSKEELFKIAEKTEK